MSRQGDSARFAAIWEKGAGIPLRARHNMTSSKYQDAFEQFLKAQDLTIRGPIAQASSEVGDGADRRVVLTSLVSDQAQRRVPRRDPDSQSEIEPELPPAVLERPEGFTHRERHPNRLRLGPP